jgi:hypothetical protein
VEWKLREHEMMMTELARWFVGERAAQAYRGRKRKNSRKSKDEKKMKKLCGGEKEEKIVFYALHYAIPHLHSQHLK